MTKQITEAKPFISLTGILMMFCQLIIQMLLDSQWTWDKRNNRSSYPCLISWQLPQILDINDQLATRIYNKRDDSHFVNIDLPHFDRNIPTTVAFRVTHTLRSSCQFIFRLFTPSSYY